MDSDGDDYVFYGTPIEREEEISSRQKKAVAESSGHLRSLPVWRQEVIDEEERRRFHGAFTERFSAGYYNTVGSEKGLILNRAEFKQQSILNFLDEDEKAHARKQAEKEQQQRPSAIPGLVPDEISLPVTESIGVKLLLKMGWRNGHSIKDSNANSQYDARREARKAFLAFSSDDSKAQLAESEPVKGNIESSTERPANDDVLSYKSTPVRNFPYIDQLIHEELIF
ncbi:hypothetical protein I3843_15G103100 [Carya illinoinensis]|nr:hypothetical protein I3843_15G103100 [Carya illinoinensis]